MQEALRLHGRERLAVQHDGAGQLQARRDVLQDADQRIRNALRAVGEQDQRQRGDQARADQQRVDRGAGVREAGAAGVLGPQQVHHRRDEQDAALDAQRGRRLDHCDFADQPVEGERERQRQCNPRRRAELQREPGHARCGDRDGEPLPAVEPLFQHDHAEQHVDQRVDEVAEAGLDDVAAIDRPDVQPPVQRNQHRAGREQAQQTRLGQQRPPPRCTAAQREVAGHQHEAPGKPVRHDLQRGHLGERLPIHRKDAPDQEGADGRPEPFLKSGWHGAGSELRPRSIPTHHLPCMS